MGTTQQNLISFAKYCASRNITNFNSESLNDLYIKDWCSNKNDIDLVLEAKALTKSEEKHNAFLRFKETL